MPSSAAPFVVPLLLRGCGMSNAWRFLIRAFVALALLSSFQAHALIPTISGWSLDGGQTAFPTKQAACVDYTAKRGAVVGRSDLVPTITGPGGVGDVFCKAMLPNSTNDFGTATFSQSNGACPVNSTRSGSACQCNAGYSQNSAGTACEIPNPCAAVTGKPAGSKTWAGSADEFYFCDAYQDAGNGKCVARALKGFSWWEKDGTNVQPGVPGAQQMSQGAAVYTGQVGTSCSGSGGSGTAPAPSSPPDTNGNPPLTPEPGTAAPSPCPPGQAPGTVNGATSCYPMGTDGTSSTPSADTGTKQTTGADGTKQTTKTEGTTTCTGDKCTTTNTRTNTATDAAGNAVTPGNCPAGSKLPDGTPGCVTSSTDTVSREDFCKANSNNVQCGGNGTVGGTGGMGSDRCKDHPSEAGCGGDPSAVDGSKLYTKKEKTVKGVLTAAKDTLMSSPVVSAVPNFFTVSGGGNCPVSQGSFSLFGQSMTFRFDAFCSSAAATMFLVIRGVLMLLAAVWAFRVAFDN